jgi:DNA repair exonuclease SbcCD ATPase subunit
VRISRITTAFGDHSSGRLELPDAGIVLITGHNGAGKSSCIEAVAHAVWDSSIRKKPLWDRAANGAVSVTLADGSRITRAAKKRGTVLEFDCPWGKRDTYENQPKAQDALEHAVGSFDIWRKTCVFSAKDVDSFTSSDDADRKRLIESILGLERLDEAHASALKEQRERVRALEKANADYRSIEYAVSVARDGVKRAEDLVKLSAPDRSSADIQEAIAEADTILQLSSHELGIAVEGISKLSKDLNDRKAIVRGLQNRVAAALQKKCSMCGQAMPHTHEDEDALKAEIAGQLQQCEDFDEALEELGDRKASKERRLSEARAEMRKLRDELAEAKAHEKAMRNAEESARVAAEQLEDQLDALDAAKASVAVAEQSVATAETAAKVLSTKGVRAHIMGGALTAIEEIANTWLAKVAGSMELRITPYVQNSKGGMKDALGIEVIGAGGGNGYGGASSGECRRIDVALMLALAEVAEYAHGVQPGTLFFDEVFDSLDTEGVTAVCEVLGELSETRAIVVITHNEEIMSALPVVTKHYVANKGVLSEAV